jgi:two-component system chemotaxis response regulator CheY
MTKILILESHPAEVDHYLALLQESQFAVEAASNFNKSLDLFKKAPADIIIFNTASLGDEEIKKLGELRGNYPTVKILAVSAGTESDASRQRENSKFLKIDSFIRKPIEKAELLSVLQDACAAETEGSGPGTSSGGKPESACDQSQPKLPPKHVLVVEDSITAQKMYEIYVKGSYKLENLKMVFAGTAEKGLSLMAGSTFHLIILDWELPGMSGLKFLQKVREKPDFDDVRIIMCTSANEKPKIIKAISMGVNDYMVKPVNQQAFIDKIYTILKA